MAVRVESEEEEAQGGVDTPEECEGKQEPEPADSVPLKKKKLNFFSFFKVLFVFLLLSASIKALSSSKKVKFLLQHYADSGKDEWEPRQLPAATVKDIIKSEEELKLFASKLNTSWGNASPRVRAAFTKYFVPSTGEESGENDHQEEGNGALALYNSHVERLLGAPRPDPTDAEALKQQQMSLLLLRGVCGAAATVLQHLSRLEQLHKEDGAPVPVLGLGAPLSLPPLEELLEEEEGVTAGEFLKPFGLETKPEKKGVERSRVPFQGAMTGAPWNPIVYRPLPDF
ncbi:hypothetical protein EBH_0028080 [Eimeria brunetti]|uniref:Uncharacterized protein n=1 Tax=Eimeria brunetti TaxID=51314 RepID=U6LPG0_9EIME|nr:hypothetical protein EBH_0028080 [Eimeria brunetti]